MERVSEQRLITSASVAFLPLCIALLCRPKCWLCADVSTRQGDWNATHTNATIPLKIKDICQGVGYIWNQDSRDTTILQTNASTCEAHALPHTTDQGVVYGVCDHATPFCTLHVQVPKGMYVRCRIRRLLYEGDSRHWKTEVISPGVTDKAFLMEYHFHDLEESFVDSAINKILIVNTNKPLIDTYIEPVKHRNFIVKHALERSTYLVTPHTSFNDFAAMHFADSREVPMMYIITFQHIAHLGDRLFVTFIHSNLDTALKSVERVCISCCRPSTIIHSSQLQVKFVNAWCWYNGLRMLISVIPMCNQPVKLPSGLFNCSVQCYPEFEHHLRCNQWLECEDGRDETEDCPFSSGDCKGMVASTHKCFRLIIMDEKVENAAFSKYECLKMGEKLANVKSSEEKLDFNRLLLNYITFFAAIGLRSGWQGVPFLYSKFRAWHDSTLIYSMNHFYTASPYVPSRTFTTIYATHRGIQLRTDFNLVACELKLQSYAVFNSSVILAQSRASKDICLYTRQYLFICLTTFAAHMFLSCDAKSHCTKAIDSNHYETWNVSCIRSVSVFPAGKRFSYAPFRCDDDMTTLHHTLLCDFRQDCSDRSDESFCEFSCSGFLCSNGQCVSLSQYCNQYTDCVDDSDEVGCPDDATYHAPIREKDMKPQFYVDLDGTGYFTQQLMTAEHSCPHSHYRCTFEWLHCLPVYTKCNGYSDCVYGEDELRCDIIMCPGFYRCRASKICVHGHHLCDGWGQCPQRDDELMCDRKCPEGCQCQGHVFLCSEPVLPGRFPQLRYVDATGSNMSLTDFKSGTHLIVLILTHCSIANISFTEILNLKHIDLAHNNLRALDMAVFLGLPNLRSFQIENNPLSKITSKTTKHVLYSLTRMDISQTHLNILHNNVSLYLPQMILLNISFGGIVQIDPTGFKNMPQIRKVDVRGNALVNFPLDMFSRSEKLQHVFTSNYRVCCRALLPQHLAEVNCYAPRTAIPSCLALLPSELHRVFFWLVGVCAITGYVVCFTASSTVTNMVGSNAMVAITHLQFADVCMGCHVSIIVAADLGYRGQYMKIEKTWTSSVTCKVAGFLSFLSGTVSSMIACYITLYHISVFLYPDSLWSIKKCLTAINIIIIWIVGIVLALIPFLPGLSHWGLKGQSGLCRLALGDHSDARQRFLWFTVMVEMNFILCFMTGAGQVILSWKTPKHRITLSPAHRRMYSSVHVMKNISVTYAVCWFLFGMTILMNLYGGGIFAEIHDIMIVFILPCNSALNPLLYMWTVNMQRQRQKQEMKILLMLKSRARTGKHASAK